MKSDFQKPNWPRDGEIKSWTICYVNCLAASEAPARAAAKAAHPIEHLAGIGFEKQAIRILQRFIERLPEAEHKQFLRLCLLGAAISLDLPYPRSVEKFLRMAESRAGTSGSKQSKTIKAVQKFRKENGLVESDEKEEWDEDQPLAKFGKARQLFHSRVKAGDRIAALRLLTKMRKLILEVDYFWIQSRLTLSLIKSYQRLEDKAGLVKYIRWIDKNGRDNALKTGNLAAMGLRDIAVDRAQRQIQDRLKLLRTTDDPNIHFPVYKICENLDFMIHVGDKANAKKLLEKTLREIPKWKGMMAGFATSGVFTCLAEILVEFGEHELAGEFLSWATDAGKAERHKGFRKGAIKAASESSALFGGTVEAIEKARKVRSPKSRRKQLVPLLVKIGDWKELKNVLNEVDSAKEATDLALAVKYALPAGTWI